MTPTSRFRGNTSAIFFRYYGYPYYWGYPGVWGVGVQPGGIAAEAWNAPASDEPETSGDVHLRSAGELRGYDIQGTDDAIGYVEDFIVDDQTWEVRYLVIDTGSWWLGKKVLIASRWATRVSWDDRKVHVDLSRQVIKAGPEWDPSTPITREYEERLHGYYRRPPYWEGRERDSGTTP